MNIYTFYMNVLNPHVYWTGYFTIKPNELHEIFEHFNSIHTYIIEL